MLQSHLQSLYFFTWLCWQGRDLPPFFRLFKSVGLWTSVIVEHIPTKFFQFIQLQRAMNHVVVDCSHVNIPYSRTAVVKLSAVSICIDNNTLLYLTIFVESFERAVHNEVRNFDILSTTIACFLQLYVLI